MAYALLADMRIDLFRKLDALAPSYLLRRRSGDLVALATQDVETVEYFFAHTIAPAIVAVLVPVAVIATLAWFAWPLACVLAPFLQYAGASPVLGRQRIDRLGSAAREALGLIGAYATETIQGLAELVIFGATVRRRDGFMTAVRAYQTLRLSLLDDLSFQAAMLDAVTGLGGLAVAAIGAVLVTDGIIAPAMLPLLVLISVAAFLPVSEIAQVGRQLADTIASTRRLHVVHAEPVLINDGKLEPAVPSGGSGVRFEDVDFTYPGRTLPAVSHMTFDVPPGSTVAFVGPSGRARPRSPTCCCGSGTRSPGRSGSTGSICAT
jgi:ATP-binding cassette subfamily C protein CydCD